MGTIVTWDDGTEEEYTGEVAQTVTWDDGSTSEFNASTVDPTNEPMTRSGEGTMEEPYKLEGGLPSGEIASETARDSETEVSNITSEVQQAITTIGDQLDWTDDSEKANAKFKSEISRVLTDKGYKVIKEGEDLVAVDKYGNKVPVEAGMMDSIKASGGEMLGGIGAAMGAGAAGGAIAGPVGATVGAIGGGIAGAIAGDQYDVSRNADKHGIEISDDERLDRALEVGTTDALAGVVGVVGSKIAGNLMKRVGALFSDGTYTSIKDLPPKYKNAMETLQKQSGLDDKQMELKIEAYAKTTDSGKMSNPKAVEAASKSSETEQVGYTVEAMKTDTKAKEKGLNEITERSEIVEKAMGQLSDELDDEGAYKNLFSHYTLDDEGRRKATDWKGLKKALDHSEMDKSDPIYKMVTDNAEALGSKDTNIFQEVVRQVKPDDKAAKFVQPWTETTRGSISSQKGATGIKLLDDVITYVFPSADKKTVDIIKRAIKETTNKPKQLEQALVDAGIDKAIAKKLQKEVAESTAQREMDAIVADSMADKEADKAWKAGVDEWQSKTKIPTDLNKRLNHAKKTGDREAVESIKKELEEDAKTSMKAGINKQIETDNKAREASIAKKAKTEQTEQTTKAKEKAKREADYGKQADEEVDRLAKEDKAIDAGIAKAKKETSAYYKAKEDKAKSTKIEADMKKAKEADNKSKEEAKQLKDDVSSLDETHKRGEADWKFDNKDATKEELARLKELERRARVDRKDLSTTKSDNAVTKYRKEVEANIASRAEAKLADTAKGLGDFFEKEGAKLAKEDSKSVFKRSKPMSENAINKAVKENNTGTKQSSVELNSMQGQEHTPVTKVGQFPKDVPEQAPAMQKIVKSNKKARQEIDKSIRDGNDEQVMENALKSDTYDELDRPGLEMAMNHPTTSSIDKKLAEQRLGILDKKNVKEFEAGDIAPSSKKGRQAQTTIRTNGVKDTGNKALIAFDQDYKGGGWAGKAADHGRKLARDAENAPSAAEREVILNNKKYFDEGLSDYYDSKDSIPNSVTDYLAGKPATVRTPVVKKPKEPKVHDDGVVTTPRGDIDRRAMAKTLLKDKITPEQLKVLEGTSNVPKWLKSHSKLMTAKELEWLTQKFKRGSR